MKYLKRQFKVVVIHFCEIFYGHTAVINYFWLLVRKLN